MIPGAALAQESPTPEPRPDVVPAGAQVHLPVLASDVGDQGCSAWVAVQNLGPESGKVVLVSWSRASLCGPDGAGPVDVSCSGLLAAGNRWSFALIPKGPRDGSGVYDGTERHAPTAYSAAVFSFNSRVYESDIEGLAICDFNADLMCETLYFGVQRDAEDYRRFKVAFDQSLRFAGLEMSEVAGSPIRATVYRRCDTAEGSEAADLYNARVGVQSLLEPGLEPFGADQAPWDYHVPLVSAASDGTDPGAEASSERLYLQNTGWACATVRIWARPLGGCGVERELASLDLAPGEQRFVEAGDTRFPELGDVPAGSLRLSSDQRLALVAESRGPNWLASTEILAGAEVLNGPLPSVETAAGWSTRLHLLAPADGPPSGTTTLRIAILDASGAPLGEHTQSICPLGSRVIELSELLEPPAAIDAARGLRIEVLDQESWAPQRVVALVETLRRDGDGRVLEASRYPLEPDLPWIYPGAKLLSLPILTHAPGSGLSPATVSLHNANLYPGFTDLALYLFDQNGYVQQTCQRLTAGQTLDVQPAALPLLADGFQGSATISASHWEHPVPGPVSDPEANRPNLTAALVERWPASAAPAGGSDAHIARAQPFDRLPDELRTLLPSCVSAPDGPVAATPAPGQATPRPPLRAGIEDPRPVYFLRERVHLPLVLTRR